jgi:ACR3 family arsenite transporter
LWLSGLQSYGIFAIGFVGTCSLKLAHDIAGPVCLIGTSNFFELAVAVMLSLVWLVKRSQSFGAAAK